MVTPSISVKPNSILAEALIKMVEHKRLRHSFRKGEITLDELNRLLTEKGIKKQYENSAAV